MIDSVLWSDVALEQLGEIWLESTDRTRITSAAHRIEQNLRRRQAPGVIPLSEGLFKYDFPPLRVFFEIDALARLLKITAVREI